MREMKGLYVVVMMIFVLGGQVLSLPVDFMCPKEFSINRRIVLAVDVSASMESQDKMKEVQSALKNLIANWTSCSTQLGMVQFSSRLRTKTLSGLLNITEMNRQLLYGKIPGVNKGDSCVACGLEEAVKAFSGVNNARNSSVIVVITDANDSDVDFDEDFLNSMETSQIQVVVVVLSEEMEPLKKVDELTKRTDGFVRYIQDENIASNLLEVLTALESQVGDTVTILPTTENSTILNDTSVFPTTEAFNESTSETSITSSHISDNSTTVEAPTTSTTVVVTTSNVALITTLEVNVSVVVDPVDSTTSVLDVTVPTEPSLTTLIFNNTTIEPPAVSAFNHWLYLGVGALIVIGIAVVIALLYRCCRKSPKRPCASHGYYAPVNRVPARPIHGDQVLNSYANRPNSCYS